MKLSEKAVRTVVASLDKLRAEVEAEVETDDFEARIPEELKAEEEFDLELDNSNPMVAADEDDVEALELEDEEKGEEGELTAAEEDPVVNVTDIIKGADNDGNIKLSCIKALCDKTVIPDDKADEDIEGCIKASVDKPGVEDEIGNEAEGGDPSTSKLKDIISSCDRLADYCEKNGMKKIAYRIDVISNTLSNELNNQ